jgi:hypothetical protein
MLEKIDITYQAGLAKERCTKIADILAGGIYTYLKERGLLQKTGLRRRRTAEEAPSKLPDGGKRPESGPPAPSEGLDLVSGPSGNG